MSAAVRIDTSVLERISRNLDTNVAGVGLSMAFLVEADAKQRAAVDTGAMRNSINVYDTQRVPFSTKIGPHVDYAIYQEYGTRKMAAHPFLTPAVEFVRAKFENASTWKDVLTK